ncbi:hypothetical protein Poly51_60780 [Rubripirellula tenax]|uniref:Uncharacterized protein n=1 Tax=Rubripirellula tenax TaxID=2528015 RepID=A0A5C6E6E2_9BACT|nr:hypothetical protein [Rubripirellula tenax]TWU44512.1 hypothetical protein Poly51_60780 [Rubripirellula tenax]
MIDSLPERYRRDIEVLVESYGTDQSIYEYISAEQKKHFPKLFGVNRIREVDWSSDQHVARATQHLMSGYALLERGYAKRIHEDRPEELARAASTFGRLSFWWGTRDENDGFLCNANDLLKTLASGDIELVQRYTAVTPQRAITGPMAAKLLHAGITAVISHDRERLADALDEYETWKKPKTYISCMYATLRGLLDSDAVQVAQGLDALINASRKIFQHYDLFKYICLEPHGLYELCRWYDAELVSEFNPDRCLPWDNGLYQWVRSNESRIPHYDVASLSTALQEWLVQLPFRDELAHHWPSER